MRIHIFDVEHGECNAIETPTGDLILIGVGHNSSTNWRPSNWVRARGQRPACVVLSNLDGDHLSDIAGFTGAIEPASIKVNHHIQATWLGALKLRESGAIHPAVSGAMHWMANVFTGAPLTPAYGLEWQYFYNHPLTFPDSTNNLSVVTFLSYNGVGVMFPGDLEAAGWRELLKDPTFVDCLMRTNVLVASHHGRIGGYCQEVFGYCGPDVVIISDKAVIHDTQQHDEYSKHCCGIRFDTGIRKVLTTRSDGKITIDIPGQGGHKYFVTAHASY